MSPSCLVRIILLAWLALAHQGRLVVVEAKPLTGLQPAHLIIGKV